MHYAALLRALAWLLACAIADLGCSGCDPVAWFVGMPPHLTAVAGVAEVLAMTIGPILRCIATGRRPAPQR